MNIYMITFTRSVTEICTARIVAENKEYAEEAAEDLYDADDGYFGVSVDSRKVTDSEIIQSGIEEKEYERD